MIAALYIDSKGVYPTIPGVDCWDVKRNAKLYTGPYPVIAHPPCGPWGMMAYYSTKQDPECALKAIEQVRLYGGILEHPQASNLFYRYLPLPREDADSYGGYTIKVNQVEWGHLCKKPTWLYCVGIKRELAFRIKPPFPKAKRKYHIGGDTATPPQYRHLTPRPFAEWLVSLVKGSFQ